jgi:hypothetical protein
MLLARLKRKKRLYLSCFLLCILVWIVGCSSSRDLDKNDAEAQTRFDLWLWGETLTTLVKAGENIEQFKSCEEVLSKYKEGDLLTPYERTHMKNDYWGKPFNWSIIRKPDKYFIITIISAGRNGVFENGKGDDLYMEIECTDDRMNPKIRFSDSSDRRH